MIKQSQDDKEAQGQRIERHFVPDSIHISHAGGKSPTTSAGMAQTWQKDMADFQSMEF